MNSPPSPKIIIITGPCGVGKTTLTQKLADKLSFKRISGDDIKNALFPDIPIITEKPECLAMVKDKILTISKINYRDGYTTVIDYVILGKDYINKFRQAFGKDLIFKVLLPDRKTIYERDKNRQCWSSGKECIDELYDKYVQLIDFLGEENYINNNHQTEDETLEKIIKLL